MTTNTNEHDETITEIIRNTGLQQRAVLILRNAEIKELPLDIGSLTNLHYLYLENNNLETLPSVIGNLSSLQYLDLSNNNIRTLPPEIGKLSSLRVLNLEGNQLQTLPNSIAQLKELQTLNLRDNPIPIPPEIKQNTEDAKTLLTIYSENFKRPLNEAKVLLVGQGSVGKTSIIKRLILNQYHTGEVKTDGIAINKWEIKAEEINGDDPTSTYSGFEQDDYQLNVWDFGGQEIMHATHQFFLTKRSLYILVINARQTQEENRVEYWLKIIQSFGGDSPIIIVGNQVDEHPLDIDRTGLQKKHPNIIGVQEVSAKTGFGIKELKSLIIRQLKTLPHIRDLLPEKWFEIKSTLEKLGQNRNYLTQEEYLALCVQSDIVDEISQKTLISFLHDLGVVIHFHEDPRLAALGILNPHWVTNGVYKILNSAKLFYNQGKLSQEMLGDILASTEYPSSKRLFIIDMMRKFELCYNIEVDDSFLVPDLLPKDEPEIGEWKDALSFQFHYDILPPIIVTRFIVRTNALMHNTVWRSGVILKNGENHALIKSDTENNKINIWVNGRQSTRRDFLAYIRGEFDVIHSSFPKLEVRRKIPHPNYPDLTLDYEELIEFEHQDIRTFPKTIKGELVVCHVRKLLAGVNRPPKPKIFISYSNKDEKFATRLADRLLKSGFDVWQDTITVESGQIWMDEIQKGITESEAILLILSPNTQTSTWVTKEVSYAEKHDKKILPILHKPCDIPLIVAEKQYEDFTKKDFETSFLRLKDTLERTFNITRPDPEANLPTKPVP